MTFDPTTFLDQTVTGANSTERMVVPEGEYPAIADKVEVKSWASRDGSSSGLKLLVTWDIQDDGVKTLFARPKVTSRQDLMLDLTDTGALDMGKGKNRQLGLLREALNLNDPKKPFSFIMITGQMGKVSVKHRIDGADIYDEVKAVARL